MRFIRFVCLFLFAGVIVTAQPKIHYTLSMTNPSSHYFEVMATISNLPTGDETVDLQIGAWRSGRYVILDFASGVTEFHAKDPRGNVLPWKKSDKQTWTITKEEGTSVIITYKVYANEFNLRTRGLNDEHAFIDPVAVFMYLREYQDIPLTLAINPYGTWKVTTGLDQVEGRPFTFEAPNFEYFADCPIEIGNHKTYEFEYEGKQHIWMMEGEAEYDIDRIIEDTKKLIAENLKFWGRLPYERYIFMLHISPSSGGGTEHLNSTIMGTRPFTFKNERSYRGFLGLVSHEYFHTWNVKQLRPAGITPYDWSKENYSEEWWLAEGGTSYFDQILMMRAGLSDVNEYISGLGRVIERDRQQPGNMKQSVTQASFDAWIGLWKGNQNAYNDESNYYGKGTMATGLLDMEILKATGGERSLQDVMKAMFERFPVFDQGYTVADLQEICEEFAGVPMGEFFGKYIYGADPYPWEDALSVVGLTVTPKEEEGKASLGMWSNDRDDGVHVRMVIEGGSASMSGLDVGDVIVALNGYKVKTSDINARVGEAKPGDRMTFTLFRNGMLRTIDVTLKPDPVPSYTVARVDEPTDAQKKSYEKWLGISWPE